MAKNNKQNTVVKRAVNPISDHISTHKGIESEEKKISIRIYNNNRSLTREIFPWQLLRQQRLADRDFMKIEILSDLPKLSMQEIL